MDGSLSVTFNNNEIVSSNGEYVPCTEHGIANLRADFMGNIVDNGENDILFHVFVDGVDTKSSFLVSSDCEWVKLIRQRNDIRVLIEPNHDIYAEGEGRICNITFQHNTVQDVTCIVCITQDGEVYDIKLCDGNNCDIEEVVFGNLIGKDSKTLTVKCVGGREKYKIFKPKKFVKVTSGEFEYDKRIAFDFAIDVSRSENDQIIISTDGSLDSEYSADDTYYVITVCHSDVIGLTDSIKVSFTNSVSESDIPILIVSEESQQGCADLATLPPNPIQDDNDNFEPSIVFYDERSEGVFIVNSNEYTDIVVQTDPVESLVYFNYYGSFIDGVNITHDGEYSTISVKAKPNKFSSSRSCIGYIINAQYPSAQLMVKLIQEGRT